MLRMAGLKMEACGLCPFRRLHHIACLAAWYVCLDSNANWQMPKEPMKVCIPVNRQYIQLVRRTKWGSSCINGFHRTSKSILYYEYGFVHILKSMIIHSYQALVFLKSSATKIAFVETAY